MEIGETSVGNPALERADFPALLSTDALIIQGSPKLTQLQFPHLSQIASLLRVYVDGDGDLDLVVALAHLELTMPDRLAILRNDGTGAFTITTVPTMNLSSWKLLFADMDGDGHGDVIALDGSVYVYRGDGQGGFAAPEQILAGYYGAIDVGDLNGDGRPDIATILPDAAAGYIDDMAVFVAGGY